MSNLRCLLPSLVLAAAAASTSPLHAEVLFANTYTDAPGTGFFDPVFGAQRQAAWEFAENAWASKLLDLYTPGDEVINVRASFQNLGGSATSAVVGNAQPFISHYNFSAISPKFQPNTIYAGALANHMAGFDLSPGNAEITATFNSNIDSGNIIGGRVFYYRLDGNPNLTPPSQIDFVTVAMHELAHGLGFSSSISSSGTFADGYTLPNAFDRFLYRASTGQFLVNEPDGPAGNAQRAADITSNDLYFRSLTTIGLDGPDGLKLYAPAAWELGSSVTHIDTSIPDLMNKGYTGPKRDTVNDLAVLSDIGWDTLPIPEPATLTLLTLALPLLLKRRHR